MCVDEKTSLQPCTRQSPTLVARPRQAIRVEYEYGRAGALKLFAAFDTPTGRVERRGAGPKRLVEFIAWLEQWDGEIPTAIATLDVVPDNLGTHKGKPVPAWLAKHRRFVLHHLPVYCSWMNQMEQRSSNLRRKRLRVADFPDKLAAAERPLASISEWNQVAHPFNRSTKSLAKIMAKCRRVERKPAVAA
jgi:DDE superfamily endonuclease